ncbi:hypothetical protein HF086_008164 [Spodoptera exigua]|uniref:Uncharacterized protein n=1 Tax=Spodoptera exigua TaxID=7107 RepID=A0A922M3N0_SPOEX|nr:hypothetical protein HF086_008164 [Spodoptera exigua]
MDGEEKSHEEKKSKIPLSRLRQPRRSSIPKLKDPKKVKRDTSLKFEPQVDDEFEKLYEEIVDDKPIEVEVKLPLVSIDDPEKIETKFEELIHAYDEEEEVIEQVEKPSISKVSKIPALIKKDDSPSLKALMERVKEVSAAETKLKDGGFKVTASNIRTKRFSRGNSDLSRDEQRAKSIDGIDVKNDDDVFDKDKAHGTEKDANIGKTDKKGMKTRSIRSKSELIEQHRQTKLREDLRRKQKQLRNGVEDPVIVDKVCNTNDNIDDLNAVLIKTERIVRNISREINDDKHSITSTETVTTEELNDGGKRTVTTKTTETFEEGAPVVHQEIIRNISREHTENPKLTTEEKNKTPSRGTSTGIPVKTERFTRGISREMGNFKQSIQRKITPPKENLETTDNKVENKPAVKKETMRVEQIEKEGIKIGIPVFTKVTRSYSKGRIQNVEMTRTIEWKPADVITNKAYTRSVSEKVTKKELKDTKTKSEAETNENNPKNGVDEDTTKGTAKENNTKETVKEAAVNKTIRKVTEFKTEEQVTNEERTTFTLSKSVDLSLENDFKTARAIGTQMSIDGQNIDRDYKIGKDASTKISVINEINDSKDLKPSREMGTQMSVDISKVQEEKHEEINKGQIDTEKSETEDNKLHVKEKDSDVSTSVTPVTNLKGNVNRLKENLVKDKGAVSKRDKEEELPKKKSVLSKIAMFERLERDPIELPLRKLKCKYVPPTRTTYQAEEEKEVKNITTEEPKADLQLEPNTNEDKVEISVTYDAVAYTNEPIIVKEYLKSEYNENLLKDNKEKTTVNTEEDTTKSDDLEYTAPVTAIPEIVNLDPNEIQIEIPKTPEPRKETEMPTIFPPRRDYEADIGRTRPGKLNLNNWTSQVEINKSTVDKVAVFKEEQIQEIVQTLPAIDIKAYASQVSISKELSRNFDIDEGENNENSAKMLYNKVEIQFETAQTLPEVIDVTPVSNIEITDNENEIGEASLPPAHESPEHLLKTKTKPGKLDLSSWKNRVEESRIHIGKDIKNKPKSIGTTLEASEKKKKEEVFRPRRISDTIPLIDSPNNVDNKNDIPKVDSESQITNETVVDTYQYAVSESDVPVDELHFSSSESNYAKSHRSRDRYGMPMVISKNRKNVEEPKRTPGKLDLNQWKSQVEANRGIVDKDIKKKPKKAEIITEAPGKKVFKPYSNTSGDLNAPKNKDENSITDTEHKSEIQVEIATILPEIVAAESIEAKAESAKPFIALIDVNRHVTTYVPNEKTINTEEQPNILNGKIDLETGYTYESKSEIGMNESDTVRFVEENVTTLPAIITFETNDIKVESPKPGKINLKAWEDQVEANKVLVDKIEVVRNEHLEDVAKTLTGKVEFVTFENVGEARMFQATAELNTDENKFEITESADDLEADIDVEVKANEPVVANLNYFIPRQASREDQLNNKEDKAQTLNELVSESLSDPELVDEPVEKSNFDKDSVIGSVKRKLYFLSGISRVQNPVIREESRENDGTRIGDDSNTDELETRLYVESDLGSNSNAASIEDIKAHSSKVTNEYKTSTPPNTAQIVTADIKDRSSENVFHFDVTRVENRMTRSVYAEGELKNSTEDMKRAKSLAELDLGDAVQGKVKRILSRINSVDFGRRESIKTAISIKEMPKKMTVLEKIALFESFGLL